jgi:hypothetical protein
MPEEVPKANGEENGKSLKEAGAAIFDAIKGPVFWIAVGYGVCKYMDRKKS